MSVIKRLQIHAGIHTHTQTVSLQCRRRNCAWRMKVLQSSCLRNRTDVTDLPNVTTQFVFKKIKKMKKNTPKRPSRPPGMQALFSGAFLYVDLRLSQQTRLRALGSHVVGPWYGDGPAPRTLWVWPYITGVREQGRAAPWRQPSWGHLSRDTLLAKSWGPQDDISETRRLSGYCDIIEFTEVSNEAII